MTQGVGWHRIDRHSAVKKSLKLEKYIFLKKFKKRLAFCLKVVYDSRVANGSLVKRLRRRPLTAETGVRFPYELLIKKLEDEATFKNESGFFLWFFTKKWGDILRIPSQDLTKSLLNIEPHLL